jgi:phosphohistidine phosphatase SixA
MRFVHLCRSLALLMVLLAPGAMAGDTGIDALRQGGLVVLIRHAATEPGLGDPPGYSLDDCASQRNLSEAGRAQSRALGAWFREHGIPVGEVRSSQWCRCLDTATLAFAQTHAITPWPALNSFFDARASEPHATAEALAALATPVDGNRVWVTHQVNITALTGVFPAMGEMVIMRPVRGEAGFRLEPVGRLRPD